MATSDGILFVDDTEILLELVTKYASKWGFTPYRAQTPEEAIQTINQNQNIKIVFIDQHLGKDTANGLQLIKVLSKFRESRFLKLCLLTGDKSKDLEQKAYEHGGDAFLSKPVRPQRLKSLIHDLLHVGDDAENVDNHYRIKINNTLATIVDSPIKPNIYVKEITVNSIVLECSAAIEEGSLVKIHCPKLSRMLECSPFFTIKIQRCRSYGQILKENGENWASRHPHLEGHHDENYLLRSLIVDITSETQVAIELYHKQLSERKRQTSAA